MSSANSGHFCSASGGLYLYLARFLLTYLYLHLKLWKNVFVSVFVFYETHLTPAVVNKRGPGSLIRQAYGP